MKSKHDNRFVNNVESKVTRKLNALNNPGRSVWMGLGVMGIVGWSVAIPTLLCLFAGLWLDKHYQMGFTWTLNLLIVGILLGCFGAWRWISKEAKALNKENHND